MADQGYQSLENETSQKRLTATKDVAELPQTEHRVISPHDAFIEISYPVAWLRQAKGLSYKVFLVAWKRPIFTGVRLFIPLLCAFCIWLMINYSGSGAVEQPPLGPVLGTVPRCTTGTATNPLNLPIPCVTFVYSPPKVEIVKDVLKIFARRQNLIFERDFRGVDTNPNQSSDDISAVRAWIQDHQNYTTSVISFNVENQFEGPEITGYRVFFNDSTTEVYQDLLGNQYPKMENNYRQQIVAGLEVSLTEYYWRGANNETNIEPSLKITTGVFPTPSNDVISQIPVQMQLVVIFLAASLPFIFALVTMVASKQAGYRGYMRIFGLKDSVWWTMTFLEQTFYVLLPTLFMLALAYAIPASSLFKHSNFGAFLVVLLVYGLCLNSFACFFGSLLTSQKAANAIACIVLLLGLSASITIAVMDSQFYSVFSNRNNAGNGICWIPPVALMKCLLDLKMFSIGPVRTSDYYGVLDVTKLPSKDGYTWGDLTKQLPVLHPGNPLKHYHNPISTTQTTLLIMLAETLIFGVASWYLDKIVPSEHKRSEPPWFFVLPSFWIGHSKSVNEVVGSNEDALKIDSLTKVYRKNLCSLKDGVTAVRPLSLTADTGTVLVFLGPNGAGKTTTIRCLVGLSTPTDGTAHLYGLDIAKDMHLIQEMLGVCPQFDVLWPQLTAAQHMYVLSSFKYPVRPIDGMTQSEKLLSDVGLLEVQHQAAGTFSGGMKRRLSVALSLVGNPLVIFLDEPSTGMDPVNQRHLWDMIQTYKRNRLFILTTHLLEEADVLGDQVAILADGKLRAYGPPVQLKHRFGTGYRLTLTSSADQVDDVKEFVAEHLPMAAFSSENAGNLVYVLPHNLDDTVGRFFRMLLGNQVIQDWGLHNSTMEDVYLSVTRKIMGQDICYVEGEETMRTQRDVDREDHKRQMVDRMQSELVRLRGENDILRRLLEDYLPLDTIEAQLESEKRKLLAAEEAAILEGEQKMNGQIIQDPLPMSGDVPLAYQDMNPVDAYSPEKKNENAATIEEEEESDFTEYEIRREF